MVLNEARAPKVKAGQSPGRFSRELSCRSESVELLGGEAGGRCHHGKRADRGIPVLLGVSRRRIRPG